MTQMRPFRAPYRSSRIVTRITMVAAGTVSGRARAAFISPDRARSLRSARARSKEISRVEPTAPARNSIVFFNASEKAWFFSRAV